MQDITLTKFNQLSNRDIDFIILNIRKNFWTKVKNTNMPKHCGLCKLLKICIVINPELTCPWLN